MSDASSFSSTSTDDATGLNENKVEIGLVPLARQDSFASSTATSTVDSVGSMQAKWAKSDRDNGWEQLHERLMAYRNDKHVTIKSFLRLCDLPENKSYYQQLCCRTGFNMHPSSKIGTIGKLFVDKVEIFLDSVERLLAVEAPSNIEDVLCDLNLESMDKLTSVGVHSICFRNDEEKLVVNCSSNAYNEDVMVLLQDQFKMHKVTIEIRNIELLFAHSPHALLRPFTAKPTVGTVTVLNIVGTTLFGISCRHCVGQVDSVVYKVPSPTMLDPATSLGNVLYKDTHYDLAFVALDPGQAISVNTVCHLGVCQDLWFNQFWDEDDPGNIRNYLLNKEVRKDGVSSGRTVGKVALVDDDTFEVDPLSEDAIFAVGGDSGSLVYSDDGKVLGMVTGVFGGGKRTVVLGIWRFYDLMVELME